MKNGASEVIIAVDVQNGFIDKPDELPGDIDKSILKNICNFVSSKRHDDVSLVALFDTHTEDNIFIGGRPSLLSDNEYDILKETYNRAKGNGVFFWRKHCIQGTVGASMPDEFANAISYIGQSSRFFIHHGMHPFVESFSPFSLSENQLNLLSDINFEFARNKYRNYELSAPSVHMLDDIIADDVNHIYVLGYFGEYVILEMLRDLVPYLQSRGLMDRLIYRLDCTAFLTGTDRHHKMNSPGALLVRENGGHLLYR